MVISLPDARQLSDEVLQSLRLRALLGCELGYSESLFQKPYVVVRLRGRLYRNRSRYFAPVSRRSIN